MKANVFCSGVEKPARVIEIADAMIPRTAEQEDALFAEIEDYLRGDGFAFTAIELEHA